MADRTRLGAVASGAYPFTVEAASRSSLDAGGGQDSGSKHNWRQLMNAQATVPRVVIVGAGFAGLHAARGLRDAPVQVTVIDRTNHHLFQPLLYQVATASLSPADISAPIRG